MFAYVDETGNTGSKLLDPNQPLFITGALLTRSDFDKRFALDVAEIARACGADELHAAELGLGRLEGVASDLLKVIRRAGPTFALSRVEKVYVIATKMFDTLFDSYENKAVPWHVYNVPPLRMMMVFKLAFILDDTVAVAFWDALMDVNADRAHSKMAEVCRTLAGRVNDVPDKRSQEVLGQALEWASENPESLEFVYSDKAGRKGHLPNMIGFGNLLDAIEERSAIWKRPVEVIRHDRQNEFQDAMKFWHKMYSNAREEAVMLPMGGKMVLRKVFGSKLLMSNSSESAGIQIIDIIIWLFSRAQKEKIPDKCQSLLNYVYSRAHHSDFSFANASELTSRMFDAMEREVTDEQINVSAKTLKEIEQRRLDAMAEYKAKKEDA